MANRSIDYISKDFNSIVDALVTYATVNFGPDTAANRQWTNFNVDDFSRTWLELVAYVGDLIFFYLDVQATQSNLETATIRSAVLNLAKQFGFIVPTATSASGLATFSLSVSGIIPVGFRLSADNGLQFFVSSSSPVAGSTTLEVILPVIQGEQRSEIFTAIGVQNEEITLGFTPLVVDTTNSIANLRSPIVEVNSNPYTLVNTFIDSLPDDKHYRIVTDANGGTVLRFGDGIFGEKLNPNDSISVDYRTGGGSTGNIPAGTLNTLVDSASFINSVTNTAAFSGGSDEPNIDRLRELIPAALTTLERAVSLNDYGNIIIANFNNVLKAAAEENITDPGTDINIYVVPSGNTITPITTNLALFNSINDFIDERKPVTTTFQILDAFGIDVDIKIKAFLSGGASRTEVSETIIDKFEQFFHLATGDVDGAGTKFGQQILLNDIYSLLDDVGGVERYEVTKFNYIPRIVKTAASGTNYLLGRVNVFEASEPSEWLIAGEEQASSPDYIPFTAYKKIQGIVSNLSEDSLSDDNLNLSVVESATTAININGSGNVIFDSNRTFLTDEFVGGSSSITLTLISGDTFDHAGSAFAPKVGDRIQQGSNFAFVKEIVDTDTFVLSAGEPSAIVSGAATIARDQYLFVDSANNIWTIIDNDSHSLTLSAFAINNTVVSDVSDGIYKIVRSLIGGNVLFRNLIFAGIDYNTHNTIFRIGSSFNLVGTIGDKFMVSIPQVRKGNFGVPVTITGFSQSTPNAGVGRVTLADNPDLSGVTTGINSDFVLIDSNLNEFEIVGVDDIAKTVDILHQAGTTVSPTASGGGKPASLVPRYYSDNNEISLVIGQANRESGLGFQAVGTITTIPAADISDAETFVLNDGINPTVTFEFNKVGGVSGGNVAVDITLAVTATDVRDAIITAVNTAPLLAISASIGATDTVFLQNDNIGTAGNQNIIEGVADADFVVAGMSGGTNSGSSPTPVIPTGGDSSTDFGLDSSGNRIDHFEFRVSGFVDDIVNLRKSEIPEFSSDNLELDLRGGVI